MNFDDMAAAVAQAKSTIGITDHYVAAMAELIRGRLRKGGVSQSALRELKNELRKYNPHTGVWSD